MEQFFHQFLYRSLLFYLTKKFFFLHVGILVGKNNLGEEVMKKRDVLKWAVMGLTLGSAMTSCTSSSPKQDDQSGGTCSGKTSCKGKTDCSGKSTCSGKSSCGSEASVNDENTEKKLGALKQKREDAAKKMC